MTQSLNGDPEKWPLPASTCDQLHFLIFIAFYQHRDIGMALLNPLSGFQSMAASNHPLFPWNGQMIANSWDVQQLQQQKQQQQKEVESIQQKIAGMDWIGGGDDTSTSANSKSNRLQRRKVASIKHQGPVAHRHSNITVLPQFAYPILSNGTVIQLPVSLIALFLIG